MELMVQKKSVQNAECDPCSPRRRSFSPTHHNNNPIATGPTIEELLSVKYDTLNESEQTDIATTIRNAILIPNNLNVSDDCLRILCNRRAQDRSLVLDTTAESVPDNSSQSSCDSEAISDQDLRYARDLAALCAGIGVDGASEPVVERRAWRQVSPLPRGLIISGNPILNAENSGNAVFNRIGETSADGSRGTPVRTHTTDQLTFNGRIPPAPRPDHVVIQIEADTSLGAGSSVAAVEPTTAEGGEEEEEEEMEDKATAVEESFEFTNERSPDLFADNGEEDDDDEAEDGDEEDYGQVNVNAPEGLQLETKEEGQGPVAVTSAVDRLMQRDNHLLKRLQTAFSGVLPPPSVTNVAIPMDVIVSKYKEYKGQLPETKQQLPHTDVHEEDGQERYLLKCVDSPTRAKTEEWPELKNVVCHDVCYNLSNAIEQFEYLTVKYRSRFSGSDTASSFVLADISSAKKRANRTKALNSNNSPGRRLSHLARRRAIFSCANLQGAKEAAAQAQQAAVDLSRVAHRQILLPVRRAGGRGGVKGRTPGKKGKTPGSSAKKRALVATLLQRREALTRETSKRALFQSPGRNKETVADQPTAKPKVTPEVAIRVDKSKRALFSSPKFGRYPTFSGSSGIVAPTASSSRMELSKLRYNSMSSLTMRGSQESLAGSKRRRDEFSDEDEENHADQQFNKVLRTESPRRSSLGGSSDCGASGGSGKSFMRSQSFTAEQLCRQKSSLALPRTSSEMHLGSASSRGQVLALNEAEKKKLLWVVSQTLQRNQVCGKNSKFKEFATVMAKVVKRLYLETNNRTAYSVTEQMNRLANNIAFQVIQGKNELEIYSAEKLRIQAQNRKKLTGYVNSQEYEQFKLANSASRIRRMSSGVFSEASSVSLSQCSVITSGGGGGPDENYNQAAAECSSTTVLRENVDTEQRLQQQQRLSSQKNNSLSLVFNGKDQKNVSPYSGGVGEGAKRHLLVGGAVVNSTGASSSVLAKGLNVIKAKRQISFDT